MNFQNISIHGSKLMLCKIKQKWPKIARTITPTKFIKLVEILIK